ncbi:MAG: D-alanyl-D-alanine carboxypeptidase/D-alanyl-D-alanine-endopeptidase [Gemmatimonadota bacterium]|nr:D-alanyl-D-alanine carboxypeptidase/D-alanyl-D-alanine-endopeptidase [Gemmatimonadota bacterium]
MTRRPASTAPHAGCRTALATAALVAVATAGARAQPAPDKRIQQVMDRPEFAHASWGMEFYDLKAKKTVFAVNRERLFVPGSTTKVLTMGTAFELLGAAHRFHTRVYRTGPVRNGVLEGDLVLVASGDPNLSGREQPDGSYAFIDHDHSYGGDPVKGDPLAVIRDLARQVAAHGIRTVTGQVIVDASLFREGDREGGTAVTMGPLVINDNVIDIVVTPGARAGDPAAVTASPKTSYLTVFANLVTVDSGQPARVRTMQDSTDRDHRTLVMTGTVPRGPATNPRWVVPVPSRFGEVVLTEALNEAGVRAIPRLASRAVDVQRLAASYADSMVVAERVSLPLTAEARVLLKTSQNLHASNFPLLLATLPAARDSNWTGFDLARQWLVREGLDINGAVQGDGAGANAWFSPAFMTRYLAVIAGKPWARAFHDALPILGRDGTLAEIQANAPAAGQVHAKTGTYGVYDPLHRRLLVTGKGLAGYFTSKAGREIVFAIYLNNFAGTASDPALFANQALGEIAGIAWEVIK